VTFSFSCANM